MKKALKIAAIVLGIAVIVFLLLDYFAKQEIKNTIDQKLGENLSYDQIDVNVLQGSVRLEEPRWETAVRNIEAAALEVNDLSYYQYLINDKIVVDEVYLDSPRVLLTSKKSDSTKQSDSTQKKSNFKKNILIDTFRSTAGELKSRGKDSATGLFMSFSNLEVADIRINSETLKKNIPFSYRTLQLQADSLWAELNPQHYLTVGNISAENHKLMLRNTKILPKYDEQEFQKHIPFEKDRLEFSVDSIRFDNLEWDFRNENLFIKNDNLLIANADLEIYRDKQVPDDPRVKTLYNEKIRNLGVKINLDSIKIRNSSITYKERTKPIGEPARISFDDLDADIANLVNTGLDREDFPETKVNANAQFMNESPVVVDWTFDISNLNNKFTFSGNIDHFSHSALNPIFKPIMHMKVEGSINDLSFTFTGNEEKAVGDMKLRYENFKLIVLEDGEMEKNEFLSFVSNLFLDNDAITDDVVHNNMEVARDKKKSFWNFVWLFLKEGAIKTLL